jgi:hypothetical protein
VCAFLVRIGPAEWFRVIRVTGAGLALRLRKAPELLENGPLHGDDI